jgi:hypothetical protein
MLEQHRNARRAGGIVLCSCCAYVTQVGKQCKLCGNVLTEERKQACIVSLNAHRNLGAHQ